MDPAGDDRDDLGRVLLRLDDLGRPGRLAAVLACIATRRNIFCCA
jgi:hypothetical protein